MNASSFTLPAGTVCKRNGIPFKLQHATQIECHPGVWPLIKGEPPEFAQEEVVQAPRPLAPCGAAELIPQQELQAQATTKASVQQAEAMLAALHVRALGNAFTPAEIVAKAWDLDLHKSAPSMGELQTFMLPAGTALSGENIGATLRADAVVVCHPKDEYIIQAALKLQPDDQRLSTSVNHSLPMTSKPCQAACLPVMSTTKSSSLESKCCATQSRTCTAVSDVSTIQVVVSLDQQIGNFAVIASRN
ncbi:hypothetical protein [Comamonas sp. NoAH]|uniref:hypothetical protein n=1 Tax=Comamonas halotolerans TaxID=3041496 RepID=UPI0024E074A0|nr:hypothetical protein [Comamonas sp. NoAH]